MRAVPAAGTTIEAAVYRLLDGGSRVLDGAGVADITDGGQTVAAGSRESRLQGLDAPPQESKRIPPASQLERDLVPDPGATAAHERHATNLIVIVADSGVRCICAGASYYIGLSRDGERGTSAIEGELSWRSVRH